MSWLVRECKWFHFYDIVEKVGDALRNHEKQYVNDPDWLERFGFKKYRQMVNDLFKESSIIWRLNDRGILGRETPEVLQRRTTKTEATLDTKFAPARLHYRKAQRFLESRPGDPENAIKEIISAVESVGKTIYPGASTLGDVLEEMRKSAKMSPLLIATVEKFWAFVNAEPAVRHGGTTLPHVSQADAELCFHICVALIRYILELQAPRP